MRVVDASRRLTRRTTKGATPTKNTTEAKTPEISDELMSELKRRALSKFLRLEDDDLDDVTEENSGEFEHGRESYRVLADEEANAAAKDDILNSVWAFKSDFLISYTGLPLDAEEMPQFFAEKKCEDANDVFLAMIRNSSNEEKFVNDAISADGRGHFLSRYDGHEHEETVEHDGAKLTFYIYRTN